MWQILVLLPLCFIVLSKCVSLNSLMWKLGITITYFSEFLWGINEKNYIKCLTIKCPISGNYHWSEMILFTFLWSDFDSIVPYTKIPCPVIHQYFVLQMYFLLCFLTCKYFEFLRESRRLGDSFNGWEKSDIFSYC